jgi:hypothetical protein
MQAGAKQVMRVSDSWERRPRGWPVFASRQEVVAVSEAGPGAVRERAELPCTERRAKAFVPDAEAG